MKRFPLLSPLLCALFAFAVQAQDPQKPAPGPGQEPDPKILEGIMTCLAEGLPPEWKRAWFVIHEIAPDAASAARRFEANFFFATDVRDRKGKRLRPCGAEPVLDGVVSLNAYLPESQRRWTGATFTFQSDGHYEASYDYSPFKPKPATRPAARKKQESGK